MGLHNSNDKRFPIGISVGSRVFVCDNLPLPAITSSGASTPRTPSGTYPAWLSRWSSRYGTNASSDLAKRPSVVVIDPREKIIVPVVLYSLPVTDEGADESISLTDWSSLTRFFRERYVHIKNYHQIELGKRVLHRIAIHDPGKATSRHPSDSRKNYAIRSRPS